VQGISDIITIPGIINRDFADVKTIMAGMGYAVMGTASATGERRTMEAAQRAIASPLLEAGAIDGARGILINITGSSSLKLAEVQQACSIIQSAAHEDANIIFGAVMDEKMKDAVKITVIATGFREVRPARHQVHETHTSFSAAHDSAMEFRKSIIRESMPRAISSPNRRSTSWSLPCRSTALRTTARIWTMQRCPAGDAAERVADVISLDSMRSSVLTSMPGNFEQDDLDVPAFLRKRNDVM